MLLNVKNNIVLLATLIFCFCSERKQHENTSDFKKFYSEEFFSDNKLIYKYDLLKLNESLLEYKMFPSIRLQEMYVYGGTSTIYSINFIGEKITSEKKILMRSSNIQDTLYYSIASKIKLDEKMDDIFNETISGLKNHKNLNSFNHNDIYRIELYYNGQYKIYTCEHGSECHKVYLKLLKMIPQKIREFHL